MDVRILGALEARIGETAVDLGVRKARLCFAVLALAPGTPVRTERLAEVLWPEGPPVKWEGVVQSHISRLRNALEPDRAPRAKSTRIATNGDSYVLHLAPDELDAQRFERHATEGRAALAAGEFERAIAQLDAALAEWRGPVLANLAEAAERFAETRRLEELRLVATTERAEAALALRRTDEVVADLEAFVREHPLRERGWELLLLALYRSGRQADALRRFQEVRSILVNELGIEPGPSLRDLESAILRHEPALAGPAKARPSADRAVTASVAAPVWLQPADDAFIGRAAELRALSLAADRSARGRRLVIVEGEPGIGKTRLVREACHDLAHSGSLLLGGRCVEEPLHVLQPFAEAIGRLAAADGLRLARKAPTDVGALASLVPEFAVYATPLPAFDADAHRYLLFRAVTNLLDSEVVGSDVVLVLDDIQWAPAATLQLLAHVMRDDDRGNLLVIATARDTEPNDELRALTADLQAERRLERITLAGLDPDDVSRLVAARSGDGFSEDFFAKTEGNPFYVEELVRHLDESGGTLESDAVPESVRDTIARRLLRLPDETRRLLGVAAVSGAEFRLDQLSLAAAMNVDAVDDALGQATRAGVVHERTANIGTYGFSHALIQTVLRDGLGVARRARVHRRVGEALYETGGDDGDVARHLLAAASDGSDPVPGVEAAMRAAEQAVDRYTYDDAIAVLRAARVALLATDTKQPHLACRVEIALAVALRSAGIYPERDELLESAWTHAHAAGDTELAADVIIEGCATAGFLPEMWLPRMEEVRERLDESSRGRLRLTAVMGNLLTFRPGTESRELAEWALARSNAFGLEERREVLSHVVQALSAWSPIERIVELARVACDAAREIGNASELVVAVSTLRLWHLAAGDLARSDALAAEYEDIVRAVRIPRFTAGVEQRRAMRALLAGQFLEAEAHANRAYELQPIPEYGEGVAVQLFASYFEQGRLEEIRPAVEAWAAEFERPAWKIGYAVLLAEAGEHDVARVLIAPYLEAGLSQVLPPDDLYFLCVCIAATTIVEVDAPEYAPALYDLLAPHASRVIVAGYGALCWGSVHRFLGPLAALMGDPNRAAVHFEAAMAVHERLGARPFLARDRLAYARTLRATGGDDGRITELERTGLALAREIGMEGVVARCRPLP